MPYTASTHRYESMQYPRCGNSGLRLPQIALGLWHNFGHRDNFETMTDLCTTAFDAGITYFDLANNYGPPAGSAEENFGRILRKTLAPYRNELIISTKAGFDHWPGPYGIGGSRKYLIASLDASLQRLGLDYVDLFYHHVPDSETPLEETAEALCQIVRSGKALYVGISNYDGPTTEKMAGLLDQLHCPCIVNQRCYNLFDRTMERDGAKAYAADHAMGIVAFSPLAQGLLTSRYLHGIPEDSRIRKDGRFLKESSLTPQRLAQIQALQELASLRGQSLAQMAVSWLLRDGITTTVLVGASRPAQLTENLKALSKTSFTQEELLQIDSICLAQ